MQASPISPTSPADRSPPAKIPVQLATFHNENFENSAEGISSAKINPSGLRVSHSTSNLQGKLSFDPTDHPKQDVSKRTRPLGRFPLPIPTSLYEDEASRSSLASRMTSSSSYEQTSSTERSSVLTKSSSTTDLSSHISTSGICAEDEGLSVEDAIDLYLDDVDEECDSNPETVVSSLTMPKSVALPSIETVPEEPSSPLHPEHRSWSDEETTVDKALEETTANVEDSPLPPPLTPPPTPPLLTHLPTAIEAKNEDQRWPKKFTTPLRTMTRWSEISIEGLVPPLFISQTETHDQYGFRKTTPQVSLLEYESWQRPYAEFAENRKTKWMELLESNGLVAQNPVTFPPKSSKIKRYVRKGIPSEYRGAAWFWYAGGFTHMHPNPGRYQQLANQAMNSPSNNDKEHIERDLHRTFPDNIHFKPEGLAETQAGGPGPHSGATSPSTVVETEMIRALRRVLYAFSLHNPNIGYTQSLNFIAGLLLLFLSEEKAFWMLHIITSDLLPGTHEISLEGANVDLWILMVLLKETMPGIYAKLLSASGTNTKASPMTVDTRLPDITLGLTNWLMSLFIGSLPLETTLRVWDCFFYEGSKSFFRVSLAIFKAGEREILGVSDPVEIFQVMQNTPKKLLNANLLIQDSLSRRYRVGQDRIDKLRDERRAAIRAEKDRLSLVITKSLRLKKG